MTECEPRFGNKDTELALVADMDHFNEPPRPDDRKEFGWGLVVSFVLHGLAALLMTGIITGHVTEPLQDTVEVELVPPLVETVPVPEEVPEAAAPEPEPAQEEEVPPPPPLPPAPPETVEAPAEVPIEQAVEEFGEENTAPLETADETPPEETEPEEAVAEAEGEETTTPSEQDVAEAEPAETDPAGDEAEAEVDTAEADPLESEPETAAETETEPEEAESVETASLPVEEDVEAASGTEAAEDVGIAEEATREDFGVVGPIATDATPRVKPAAPVRTARRQDTGQNSGQSSGVPAGMLPARELFSRVILDDPRARSDMRNMSEGQRLNLLCMTELRAQISAVSALPPELLPRFRPPPGNVLQPRTAAFRSLGRWFDVAFRCETDRGVTRVEKFAFKIGNEIPQSQWLERGLTGF